MGTAGAVRKRNAKPRGPTQLQELLQASGEDPELLYWVAQYQDRSHRHKTAQRRYYRILHGGSAATASAVIRDICLNERP